MPKEAQGDLSKKWRKFEMVAASQTSVSADTVKKLHAYLQKPGAPLLDRQTLSDLCTILPHCPNGLHSTIDTALMDKYSRLLEHEIVNEGKDVGLPSTPGAQIALMALSATHGLRQTIVRRYASLDVDDPSVMDAHQRAVVKTLNRARGNKGTAEYPGNYGGYLGRAITNELLTRQRTEPKIQRSEMNKDGSNAWVERIIDGAPDTSIFANPARLYDCQEEAEWLEQSLMQLPGNPGKVFRYWAVRVMRGNKPSYKDIAQELDMTEGAVQANMHKGFHMMRQSLAPVAGSFAGGRNGSKIIVEGVNLTSREREALETIRRWDEQRGMLPTYEEVRTSMRETQKEPAKDISTEYYRRAMKAYRQERKAGRARYAANPPEQGAER